MHNSIIDPTETKIAWTNKAKIRRLAFEVTDTKAIEIRIRKGVIRKHQIQATPLQI